MRAYLFLGLSFLAACGTNADDGGDVDCSTVTGVDTFTVGLSHTGVAGLVDFKLMSIDPAPAPQRGDNTWVVEVDSLASGSTPMDGATLDVTPYMPAHMHGSPINATITAMPTSGQYQLKPVNLWMPGVWETTIATKAPVEDRAVFKFCIP